MHICKSSIVSSADAKEVIFSPVSVCFWVSLSARSHKTTEQISMSWIEDKFVSIIFVPFLSIS